MKLLSALAVSLLLAGPVSAETGDQENIDFFCTLMFAAPTMPRDHEAIDLFRSVESAYNDGKYEEAFKGLDTILALIPCFTDEITSELNGNISTLKGNMYENGHFVTQNYSTSRRLYLEGAKFGNGEAQHRLATLLALGKGGPQDVVTAYMWSNISLLILAKNSIVTSFRENLANIMTPAEISEAQRRARVCMASNYQDCD